MKNRILFFVSYLIVMFGFLFVYACGSEANSLGIASQCTSSSTCANNLSCLTQFKGGYCGSSGCTKNADCPTGAMCVTLSGTNYCFLICTDKVECNANRTVDNEANCSSNITRVESSTQKACVPPSGN